MFVVYIYRNFSHSYSNIKPNINFLKYQKCAKKNYTTSSTNTPPTATKRVTVVPGKGPPPEIGGECCMSGCQNCVWVKFAEETLAYYEDGGEKAMLEIEKIEDTNLKAFIKLQLKLKDVT